MGCDTICDLPDSLLTHILLNLPTKFSVRTSVLSNRWRNLWLSVPGLYLATYEFRYREVFVRFMETFMEFNSESRLQNFMIQGYYHFDRFMELIGTVVDRGLQHLDVTSHRYVSMRQNIYKSKTLVSLKLEYVELKNPEFVVSLPCLKIMRLKQVCYGNDGPSVVEKLISGCPVLEDVELITPFDILYQQVVLFLRVRSQTLKRCCLEFPISRDPRTDFTVEIDAPRLEYLRLSEGQSDSIVAKNLSSLFMIDFDFNYASHMRPEDLSKREISCDFLTGISSVRRMIICERILEVLYSYSKLGPIPKFNNLYHLQARLSFSSSQLLLAFLESCPNLKNLILDFCYSEEPRQIDFTNVPRCLISTLEYVEIKRWNIKDENETKVVNYFLENSAVLKKLTLRRSKQYLCLTTQEADSYMKLLTSAKLSPICQLIID